MDTMVNGPSVELLPRFIKEMGIGLRRRTAPPGGFSPYALMAYIPNGGRRASHPRSTYTSRMSMFNSKLWDETYVDSVVPY